MADWFQPPPREADEGRKLGWVEELLGMGRRYLETQPGWKDIERAKELLSGATETRRAEGTASTQVNFAARYYKELVAQMTNLNPKWGYKAENRQLQQNENVLNKCFRAWWPNAYGTLKVKEALQHAGTGKGYIVPTWNPHARGPNKGEIELKAYGPKDVFPIMMPQGGDIQGAMAVVIREELPIHEAHATWPSLRDKLKSTRGRATWLGTGTATSSVFTRVASPVIRMLGMEKERRESEMIFPTIDIYYVYLQDHSINESGKKLAFGQPGTPWYYEVPSMGMPIPTGTKRATQQIDMNGQPVYEDVTRPANIEDCRLYPFRRLIIASETCVIKDDTSPWWHGQAPVVPFDIYKWAWEYISRPYVAQVQDLQSAYTELLRAVIDSANVRLDPPLGFDARTVSMQQMKTFTPRKPGGRLQMDMTYGPLVKPLMDPSTWDVPQWLLTVMESLPEQMQKMAGLNETDNLAKANQIPSDDTIEKYLAVQGPIVADQAKEMERSLQRLGDMVKWLFFEFYSTTRRLQVLGPDGLTAEDYDFEPGLMIPDHLPGEDPLMPSKYSIAERAYRHASNFVFHISPQSCFDVTDQNRKLLYLQLFRTGYPIDPETVSEALGLPNWGKLGDGTIIEKYGKWLEMQAEIQAQLAMKQAQVQQAIQLQSAMGMVQAAGELPGSPTPQEGRPPSGSAPPKLQHKNDADGPRTTITESR